jgi:CRISPR/Cas system-associated endonuclease/helicase Cas3
VTPLKGCTAQRDNERWLALVGVQMVYPTATLPPSKEEEFFELINARSEDVTILPKAIYHVLDNLFSSLDLFLSFYQEEEANRRVAGFF